MSAKENDLLQPLVWDVLESDFPKLVEGCERYCDDNGIALLAA